MIDQARRVQLADELVRRLAAASRGAQLYAATHPLVRRNIDALADTLSQIYPSTSPVVVGFIDEKIVVGDLPVPKPGPSLAEFARRLRRRGIERLTIEDTVPPDELARLVHHLAAAGDGDETDPAFAHIRIGRIRVDKRVESSTADMAAIRRLYDDAVSAVETLWEGVRKDEAVNLRGAQNVVHGLAQAVAQNRTALVALTALKNYDAYTFTHMVNVSILTMAQARTLGIDGPLLREFGLGGLMHDIGKVRVPAAILKKPAKLTDEEFAIMRLHPVDGAEILRRTPDLPPLVPLVAFEHHLRADGSGYPAGVSRPVLNLATALTSIADVYDAMRSQRSYQDVFPSQRVVEVLRRNDGTQFDQHLVRRFVQLLGIYPIGTAVRLSTGEVGVVTRTNVAQPHRPRVRVLLSDRQAMLERPYDVDLWDVDDDAGHGTSIAAPVDPEEFGIDPLAHL
jgi:putative nucleotidyltransferase with HDIG domain